MTCRVLLLLAVALASGCDLLGREPVIDISGTVMDASLGQPLAGLGVSLRTGGWAGGSAAARATTDAAGRFHLRAVGYEYLQFEVNDEPYDGRYHHSWEGVRGSLRDERVVQVYQTARLTIQAETDRPLRDGEWYTVNAGCLTGEAPFTTECMRGNDWNEIRLRVKRQGAPWSETVIPVYVRAGEDNVFTVTY